MLVTRDHDSFGLALWNADGKDLGIEISGFHGRRGAVVGAALNAIFVSGAAWLTPDMAFFDNG